MGCISKAALFVLNFLVFAVGVTVVVLASIIINKNDVYGNMLVSGGILTLPIIVLIVGLAIVIIGFLGCCGAMKESSCMLKTYAFIVSVLLIAQIVLGILLLVYSEEAEDTIIKYMDDVFEGYGGKDTALTKSIDQVQREMHCCGVKNYTDWKDFQGNNDVTKGCCMEATEDCFKGMAGETQIVAEKTIYTRGCFYAIKDDLQGATIGLGVACLILAIVEVLSITCACGLAKKSSHYA